MRRMIVIGIAALRVDQDVEAATVQHQPRHEAAEFLGCEGDLIHRDRMRSDRLVVPESEFGGELRGDYLTQRLGDGLCSRVVIDMRMKPADLPGIRERLCHAALREPPNARGWLHSGKVSAPGPRARCITTASTQRPNLNP